MSLNQPQMGDTTMQKKKAVLVTGGGAAGHDIAYQLRDAASVTLVDPKIYWEVPMAVPCLLVEPDAVQANGLIKINQFLRVVGHKTVFAVGDVTNLPEARLVIIAGLHVKSVVANIKTLLISSDDKAALKTYKPALPGNGMGKLMIVSLGRNAGLSSLPFGQFRASFIARKIKARDMLVGMMRKQIGLTV